MSTDLKVAKWIGYIGIIVGTLRLVDYYLYGNTRFPYALVRTLHILVSSLLMVWLSTWISKKENQALNN